MFRMLCTSRFTRVRSRNRRISIDKRFREIAVGVWSQLNYLPVGIRGRAQLRFAGIQSFHLINFFLHWISTLLYCFGIFGVIILLIKYYFKIDIGCSDHNEYYYLRLHVYFLCFTNERYFHLLLLHHRRIGYCYFNMVSMLFRLVYVWLSFHVWAINGVLLTVDLHLYYYY